MSDEEEEELEAMRLMALRGQAVVIPGMTTGTTARQAPGARTPARPGVRTRAPRVQPARTPPSAEDLRETERQYMTLEEELAMGPTPEWMRISTRAGGPVDSEDEAPKTPRQAEEPDLVAEAREYAELAQEADEEAIPEHTVSVVLNGYVPDYLQPEEETAEEDEMAASRE
jgi:hypothetical protein